MHFIPTMGGGLIIRLQTAKHHFFPEMIFAVAFKYIIIGQEDWRFFEGFLWLPGYIFRSFLNYYDPRGFEYIEDQLPAPVDAWQSYV